MTDDTLAVTLMDESWLTLEQVASACCVDASWLMQQLDEGLFPYGDCVAGVWRFPSAALVRARRMWQVERDFESGPELAALVADLLEELDALRARLR